MNNDAWPALPYDEWKETCATLHMWTQIVGKVRLAKSPWLNHSWGVTLYVTARGLTTSPIPDGNRQFEVRFDFIDHELRIVESGGAIRLLKLRPQSVANFYREFMNALHELGIDPHISAVPNEVPEAIPFAEDEIHRAYDAQYAHRFWRVLLQADRVFKKFRSHFIGKCSPVHFFWGSFDLAVTRFSGRPAPEHPGGVPHLPDTITREAYSHEVSSCGFWPGGEPMPQPVFYSYAYPEPKGFGQAKVDPDAAFYTDKLREFVLPYDAVRTAASPDETLLRFMQSTYEVAANLAHWDRAALERTSAPLLSHGGIRK
jgi:hypothetical protein